MKQEDQPIAAEVIDLLLDSAKAESMRRLYTRIEPWHDGKIRTILSPTTETGRLASSGRDWEGWEATTNLQNLPKKTAKLDPLYDVRAAIVPSDDHVLIEGDLSQAEVYATALYAHDYEKIRRMKAGIDIHKEMASAIYGVPMQEVSSAQRFLGKMTNHAANYGMSWRKFKRNVNKDADLTGIAISAKEAKKAIRTWRRQNQPTVNWWKRVEDEVRRNGFLVNAYGRRRDFLDRSDANSIIAHLPQSTIADHLNAALIRVYEKMDGRSFRLLHQIHDAILGESPAREWYMRAFQLKRLMEAPLEVDGYEVTIPAEVEASSESWADLREVA